MTGNTYDARVAEAVEESLVFGGRLFEAARNAGATEPEAFEAVGWAAIQLDSDDDYDTWEATVLARLADADKTGER